MNAELAQYEALAKELFQRVMADVEPADLHEWLSRKVAHRFALLAGRVWQDHFAFKHFGKQ